jgi:hypothetical protein
MRHFLLSFFTAAMLIFVTLPCKAWDFSAVAPSGQTLYYNIVNGEAQVTHPSTSYLTSYYSSLVGNLIIPDTVTYNGSAYFVTSIGDNAFGDNYWGACTSLTSVTVPNYVTSIGYWAFLGCTSLANITIPNSVTFIGGGAFQYCTSLTSITIPNSVTSIGSSAFMYCSSLTSISIPNTVTSIGNDAFSGCTSLTNITIPNSVTTIGLNAFSGCASLTNITIPNSVISIEYGVFSSCTSLTSVTLSNSVTSIEGATFFGCISLTNITLPNSLTTIGHSAFSGCTSLTSITIPNSVTSIGGYAFYECSSLTSVTIPNSVTSIGWNAFYGCVIDTLNMGHSVPFFLSSGNEALSQANIINIPCGATASYQNEWGAGNYHEPDPVVLTLSVLDDNGTLTIDSQNTQQSTFCIGSTAVIQAVANYGYHFTQWNDGNTDNPRTITLTQDTSFTAQFAKNQYTLTIMSSDDSIGTVSGGGTYEYLDEATVTAIATAAHHHFVQWSDGETDTLRTITVTQDLSLTAIFAIDTHQVATTTNNELYGSVDGAGFFPYGSTVTLTPNPENGYYFVYWNNGDTVTPNTFTVTGDTLLTALFAPKIVPSICMVSVENDHNVLSWEKDYPVSFYNIYCEGTTANEYELIATIPYSALSTYTDTASRPRTRSYRYRLSATDIYGHEADLSDIHKTMHLTINQGVGNQWNLVWTEYEGTDYTTYIIYRGTNASNIQQLDVMPSGGYTSYTDVNAPEGDVYYQVGIMLSSPCNPTKNSYIVLSNMATNSTVGIKDHDFASSMTLYPNPTTGIVNVEWAMDNARTTTMEFHVYDAFGKLVDISNASVCDMGVCHTGVCHTPLRTAQIDLSRFVPGVYFIKAVSDGNVLSVQKVVKQ